MHNSGFPFVCFITAIASSFNGGYPIISHDIQVETDSTMLSELVVGQKILLVIAVDNTLAKPVNFTYYTEVIDNSTGYTASIQTLDSNLTSLQSSGVGNSWIADNAGNYTIRAFVVSRDIVPSLLAEPQSASISVIG